MLRELIGFPVLLSDKVTVRKPIERRKTYQLVAERLTEEISSRTLKPGDLLPPERELVSAFGVGRSSVREALRILESRGLIEGRGNGTFAVSTLRNPLNQGLHLLLAADEADAKELFEVRRILEGESAANECRPARHASRARRDGVRPRIGGELHRGGSAFPPPACAGNAQPRCDAS